jgi:hypothetical protein
VGLGATVKEISWQAQAEGMMWSWSSGYKFIALRYFTSATVATSLPFKVHTGQTGTDYNASITLI